MAHKNHQGTSSGRTVKARDLPYIERSADIELLDHCRNGRPAYILHSPQMGKSSLLVHTAEQLNSSSHHAVIIDLSQFPLPPWEEEWFHTIVHLLDESLDLSTDILAWWKKPSVFAIPPHKRLTQLLTEVILPEIPTPLVLFIDEIERIAPLPFRQHFFDWLAMLYESRGTNSTLYRFSFVVCGVATPSQLIPEEGPLLFQWSHRVLLSDFTLDEALPLAEGLSLPSDTAQEIMEWLYRWTKGHPYLTQLLCQLLEEQHRVGWFEAEVDDCIQHFIHSAQCLREPHFQFVRTALTEPDANGDSLLHPYLDLLEGRFEKLKSNPAAVEQLRLIGVLGVHENELTIRNLLYQEAFSEKWVKRHLQAPTHRTTPPTPELPSSPPPSPQVESISSPTTKHSNILAASLFLAGVGLLVWLFNPFNSSPPTVIVGQDPSLLKESSKSLDTPTEIEGKPVAPVALQQAQEKIKKLEATIVRYQQLADDEYQALLEQRDQLEAQLASKNNTLSDLQSQMQALISEQHDQQNTYEQKIAQLEIERNQIEATARTNAKDLNTAIEEVKTLQMAVLKKSALTPSEMTKLMADRSSLESQLKTANTALAVAHERARNLESQLLQQQQVVKAETQQRLEDRERFETTIKELETTVDTTRQLLSTKETTALEQAKLAQSELDRLQQDRSKYQEMLATSQEELASLQSRSLALKATLAQKDRAIENDRSKYEELLAARQEELDSLQSQNLELDATLVQKDRVIEKEKQQHTTLTTEIQELRTQESQAAGRIVQLETLLTQNREGARSTLTSIEKERDQLRAQLIQTQKELNSVKTQTASLKTQLSDATTEVTQNKNALQAVHTSSSEQARRTEEKISELSLIRSTLQSQLLESQTALNQAQATIKQLENNATAMSKTQNMLTKVKEERDQYSEKLQREKVQLAKAQDRIQSLEQSLHIMSSKLENSALASSRSLGGNQAEGSSSLQKVKMTNAISSILTKLTQSPSPITSGASKLLWARQIYELSLRTQGGGRVTIDRLLRDGLHTAPIQLKGVSAKIQTLTFDPSGEHVVAGTSAGKVLSWSISRPQNSPQTFTGHSASILSVMVSPNGQHIASGSLDSTIRLWDRLQPNAKPQLLQGHEKGITSLAFRPDGKQLASGSQDHTIRLWDLTTNQPRPVTLGTHTGRVNAIAYTPDGQTLLSGGDDLTLRMWDLQRLKSPPKILRGHQQSISTIAIHPTGWTVATGSRDRQIGIWNLRQSLIVPIFLQGSAGRISDVKFSTDGTSLASVSSDKTLRIWNWQKPNQPPIQFPEQKGTLESLAISPNGQTIAIGGSSKSVTLWSSTGKLAHAVCDTAQENISFEEWKKIAGEKTPYERTCPNLPLHPSFLEEGRKLAKEGKRKQAQAIFERAKQLDPYLKFDPKKELKKLSARS